MRFTPHRQALRRKTNVLREQDIVKSGANGFLHIMHEYYNILSPCLSMKISFEKVSLQRSFEKVGLETGIRP
jgi:hypothetical protein